MTKLQFKYTKRARVNHPGECHFAQKIVRKALPYAVEYFKVPWKSLRLTIDVMDGSKDSNKITLGYAKVENNEYHIVINCAAVRSEQDYVNTFGHELTHCEQYFRRRLRYTERADTVIWEGTRMIVLDCPNDTAYDAYLKTPWEVEARLKADKFYDFYKTERRKTTLMGRLILWLRLNFI